MRNQILHGDVLEMAQTLDSGSVNCIVTSPPYYGLRDYGTAEWFGGDEGCDHAKPKGKPRSERPGGKSKGERSRDDFGSPTHDAQENLQYPHTCAKCGAIRVDKQIGMEETPEEYVDKLVLVFRELWRVLRDDGTAWLNLGDSYANSPKGSTVIDNSTLSGSKTYQANGTPPKLLDKSKLSVKQKNLLGIPWRVAFALQADGWYLRSDIIWAKPNPMPESVTDRPTKSHEYIFLLTKQAKYWYDQDAIREEQVTQSLEEAQKRSGKGGAQYDKWEDRNGFRGLGGLNKETKNYNPQGRNKRTVWEIATTPYKGAHFACFPPKLIEPCILAGCPAQVCVECGEPWVRVVEKEGSTWDSRKQAGAPMRYGLNGVKGTPSNQFGNITSKTLHFAPTCQCCPLPAVSIDKFGDQWPLYNATRPGIVLDPFFGSGTTAQVAEQAGRDWLGIDLNTDYIKLAEDRVRRTQPALFAR